MNIQTNDVKNFLKNLTNPAKKETAPGQIAGTIVGVAKFEILKNLEYSDDDAVEIHDTLKKSPMWKDAKMDLLLNFDARKKDILNSINKHKGQLEPQDMFVFFFSGHGTNYKTTGYICPHDAGYSGYRNDISEKELNEAFLSLAKDPSAPPKVLIMLDSCFSGKLISKEIPDQKATPKFQKKSTSSETANINFAEKILKTLPNAIAITSSSGEELSYEVSDLKNGVFSYYLIEGLTGQADKNNDSKISMEEAYGYLTPKVINYPDILNIQHPQIYDADPQNEMIIK